MSFDISIEVDGRRIGVAQSYRATKNSIVLSRVTFSGDYKDIHNLEEFTVVITKADRKIAYSGCRWVVAENDMFSCSPIFEELTVKSAKRMEIT